jgi:predicted transcriptional regulator
MCFHSQRPGPLKQAELHQTQKVRNQSITTALRQLRDQQLITHANNGWTLTT